MSLKVLVTSWVDVLTVRTSPAAILLTRRVPSWRALPRKTPSASLPRGMRLLTVRVSTSRVISSALPALRVPSQRWRPSKKLLSSFQAQVARPSRSPVRLTSSVRMSIAVTCGELLLKTRISPASPTGASAPSPPAASPLGELSGPPSPQAAARIATPRPPMPASSRRRGSCGVYIVLVLSQPGNPPSPNNPARLFWG